MYCTVWVRHTDAIHRGTHTVYTVYITFLNMVALRELKMFGFWHMHQKQGTDPHLSASSQMKQKR